MVLKVYNSKVEIVTNDEKLLLKVKKLLNIYWQDPRNKTQFNSIYVGRGNFFPAGYLSQFEEKAKRKKIEYSIEDLTADNAKKVSFNFNCPLEPRPHQVDALEAVKTHRMGILSSPTGSGKSFMIALTVAEKSTVTLIVTPSTSIRDALFEDYSEWFGSKNVSRDVPIKPWVPGLDKPDRVDEDESEEPKDLDENPFEFLLKKKVKKKENPFEKMKRLQKEAVRRKIERGSWFKPITILCWNSLPQLPSEYVKQLGSVIVDECHTSSVKAIRKTIFDAESAYFIYGFSATPWRDQPHMLALMKSAIGSNVIFDYSPEQAIEDEVIAKPNLNIIQADFPEKFLKNVKNFREIVDDGIIRNRARNLQIVKKAVELYDNNNQVFIAIDETSHFEGKTRKVTLKDGTETYVTDDDVSYSLKSQFESYDQEVVFISGQDSPREKQEKIKMLREAEGGFIMVGTMAVGMGTDIPGINKVILASTGESSIRLLQRIGRGTRTNNEDNKQLEVFDFMDRWNAKAKKFSIERIKTFSKYFKGCKVYGF